MSNSDTIYDVVIVGGGWAGATMAKKLGEVGKKVLVVEAGVGLSSSDRETYMETFFTAMAKVPSSPYEQNYNAPRPSVLDIKNINPDDPAIEYPNNPIKSIKDNGYFVENGAFYINHSSNILRDENRLSGKIGLCEMDEKTYYEIDSLDDWEIVENLIKNK